MTVHLLSASPQIMVLPSSQPLAILLPPQGAQTWTSFPWSISWPRVKILSLLYAPIEIVCNAIIKLALPFLIIRSYATSFGEESQLPHRYQQKLILCVPKLAQPTDGIRYAPCPKCHNCSCSPEQIRCLVCFVFKLTRIPFHSYILHCLLQFSLVFKM